MHYPQKATEKYRRIWNSAKAELTLRDVLKDKGAKGFTTNFDDLGDVNVETTGRGFDQIPGLASQRLMAEDYGFGAEGDWKSAALFRTLWVMTQGQEGGCSFLEDYTLNFDGKNSSILQAHMLEVCPLIAEERPRLEVHFLGIGDADCGGLLLYNYFSGEPVTNLSEGRPLFVRKATDKFSLANFMRANLYASVAVLKIGNDILFNQEKVEVNRITGHGGLFKTPGVGQRVLAAALNSPSNVKPSSHYDKK